MMKRTSSFWASNCSKKNSLKNKKSVRTYRLSRRQSWRQSLRTPSARLALKLKRKRRCGRIWFIKWGLRSGKGSWRRVIIQSWSRLWEIDGLFLSIRSRKTKQIALRCSSSYCSRQKKRLKEKKKRKGKTVTTKGWGIPWLAPRYFKVRSGTDCLGASEVAQSLII